MIARKAGGGEASGAGALRQRIGNSGIQRLVGGLSPDSAAAAPVRAPLIQTKLTVSEPGDRYEREADRVANAVMRMPSPDQQEGAAVSSAASISKVQRQCGDCEDELGKTPGAQVRRKGQTADTSSIATSAAANIQSLRGRGSALPAAQAAVFRDKDEGKPQPPPPKPQAPAPATAATPCIPKLKSLQVKITGSVGVRDVNGSCEFLLGTRGKSNGATFTSKVDVPAACTGTLQYVQLVDMCRTFHLTSGKDIRRKTGGYWIDTQDPIDQQHAPSAGSVEFESNDSPGQPIGGPVERVQVKDSFKIWLMWKPDQPANANRVPLAMAIWSWSAEAKVADPNEVDCAKRLKVIRSKTAGGAGKSTKASPGATKTVTKADPPVEDGKC
jgi:hypothetical protein